ncbi:MAG: hypothetical protein LT067_01120 [Sulfurovum sp.]|nr:hypothetical protein [Sulfurovum sp.]
MVVIIAIVLGIVGLGFLKMGIGTLKDKINYKDYGVNPQYTESLHIKFSWLFIILGLVLLGISGILITN